MQQQIHYFYCLRFLTDGWTPAQKKAVAEWYEGTRDWKGGNSYSGFLANIFKEVLGAYDLADREELLNSGEKTPTVTVGAGPATSGRTATATAAGAVRSWPQPTAAASEAHGAVDDALAETALKNPVGSHFAYLVEALNTPNKVELFKVVEALKKESDKPKPDDAAAYRAALLAAGRLGEADRWKVVELLRAWSNGKQFGADDGDWKKELGFWSKWFNQTFPKEPPLPNVAGDAPVVSKYKYDELLAFLTQGGGQGRRRGEGQGGLHEGAVHQVPQVRQGRRGRRAGPEHRVEALQAAGHPGVDLLPVEGHQRPVPLDAVRDQAGPDGHRPGLAARGRVHGAAKGRHEGDAEEGRGRTSSSRRWFR